MRLDYAVIGTGRSGTSFVTHVLQKHGVCMGHNMDPSITPAMRYGKKEDDKMRGFTSQLLSRHISPRQWLDELKKRHPKCNSVGVKLPGLSFLSREDWSDLNPNLVIQAWRPPEAVMRSYQQHGSRRDWDFFIQRVEENIREVFFPYFDWPPASLRVLDFSEERSEEWVWEQIKGQSL